MNSQAAALSRRHESVSQWTELCSVRVGQALFGMPISHIVEIVGSIRPEPVPLAPRFVGGLVHYRGDVLTTVSLRRIFGMATVDGPQDVLVLEGTTGCFGLLVDSVGEVLTVGTADFEPNPSTLDESKANILAGACKLKGTLLMLLDPGRLDPMRLGSVYAS